MMTLEDVWPILRLRLLTPRLELRPLRDEDIPHYVEAARGGLTDPALAPSGRSALSNAWDESPDIAANSARWIWESRLRSHPAAWTVMFGVWSREGEFLGSQDVGATDFAALRTVATGSWLRRSARGLGLGTEMRAAVLLWAFDCLGAEAAQTGAYDWNAPSIGVSRSLGYEPNGEARCEGAPGVVERELRFRLAKAAFRRPGWRLEVHGHGPAAAVLGIPERG
ncbi:GNAT family N-acetyltransferase [Sinomonas sp. RB5]